MDQKRAADAEKFEIKEREKPILHFVKWDILVVLVVGILALTTGLSVFLSHRQMQAKQSDLFAVLTVDGEEVLRVDLTEATEKTLYRPIQGNRDFVVCVENGRACIEESNCKDQICVAAGYLSDPGDMAVCIPNRAVLQIISVDTSSEDRPYDIISK